MPTYRIARVLLPVCVLLPVACSKTDHAAPAATASSEHVAEPKPASPTVQAANTAQADALNAGGLAWTAPKPFVAQPPKSSMRVAEYGVEDAPSAELAVFFFGADQGGGVEANMARWISQFQQPDGSETQAKRSTRTVRGIDIALVEASGTYGGGMAMPGMPPKAAQPDAALLGAIATGPGGSVFFKLVGTREALERARPAFDGLLESLHPIH
jgi:hypothetical protein